MPELIRDVDVLPPNLKSTANSNLPFLVLKKQQKWRCWNKIFRPFTSIVWLPERQKQTTTNQKTKQNNKFKTSETPFDLFWCCCLLLLPYLAICAKIREGYAVSLFRLRHRVRDYNPRQQVVYKKFQSFWLGACCFQNKTPSPASDHRVRSFFYQNFVLFF